MSETDSFIQEVTEEVRQDQMFALWKKWAPLILGGVAVVVGGAAYWSWNTAQQQSAAEARGSLFVAADPEDVEQRVALADQVDGSAKVLADLTAAGALAEAGQTDEAAQRYAAVAAQTDIAVEYRDLAQLQAIRLGGVPDPIAALDAMIIEASPYRLLALEHRAALRLRDGDTDAAHADLNQIISDPETSQAMRQRAFTVLTATGGTVAGADG